MIPFEDSTDESDRDILRVLRAIDRERDPEKRLRILESVRANAPENNKRIDSHLLEQMSRLRRGTEEAMRAVEELRDIHGKLTAPPWFPARFLGWSGLEDGDGERVAIVLHEGTRSAVSSGELDPETLAVGDEVFLSHERNALVGRSIRPLAARGETASFDRRIEDGRVVLKSRDDEIVAIAAAQLDTETLRKGDTVLWDRSAFLALQELPRASNEDCFVEELPDVSFESVGGLDEPIAAVKRSLRLHFQYPETARRYGLPRRGSVLLVGPPGTGKTLIAKALANWLGELSSSGRARFMNIKPGSLHSSWYSESERQYRRVFEAGREWSRREPDVPVVMFFDEVDAIGRRRGVPGGAIDDRVLTAFMTELDGLETRGDILVVAATNRRSALDPALLRPGRLGDIVLEIPRPRRRAARAILEKHLPVAIPYAASRDEVIATAVSRLYAPNADTELAELSFRDGTRRTVRALELVSGAVLANIAAKAIERACLREVEGDGSDKEGIAVGVSSHDIVMASEDELASLTRSLTPSSCRHHLDGLPTDVDVVRVEPVPHPRSRSRSRSRSFA